jgi:hypothetical protein
MKIKVVKKAASAKPSTYCEFFIDDPPMATKR